MAGYQTTRASADDEGFKGNGAAFVSQCLMEEFQHGYPSYGCRHQLEVSQAEEHGDDEAKGRDEADGYGPHDGDRDHFFRAMHFLGQMNGRVEAGKSPIDIDEANDDGNAVLSPSSIIDERGKDELWVLVCFCRSWDSYQNHSKRNEGYV